MSARTQLLGQRVLAAQLRLHAGHAGRRGRQRALAFDPGAHRVIGELGFVAHAGPVHRGVGQRRVGVENHLGYQRQPLLAQVERAQIGGQTLGQHREDARGGVDRGRVGQGVLVNGRAFFDQCVHVGDGHQHFDAAFAQQLADGELVQIERVIVVDGTPKQTREIANGRIGVAAGAGDRGQLLRDSGRELGLQAALGHDADSNANEVGAEMVVVGVHAVNIHAVSGEPFLHIHR